MIKYAIVDNDEQFITELKDKVIHMLIDVDIKIMTFTNPIDFLKSNEVFDILLLDIEMPELSGIEVAKSMETSKTLIIYLTSYTNRMIEAFSMNVYKYLLKETLDQTLKDTLIKAMDYIEKSADLLIKTESGIVRLNENEIVYLEYYQRRIHLFLLQTSYEIKNIGMIDFSDQLSEQFIVINRSTMVNKQYMQGIQQKKLIMKGVEHPLEISRYRLNDVHQALFEQVESL